MSYEKDLPFTSSAKSKIIPSQSNGLASSSVLGKRRERSENDISFPKANSHQGSFKSKKIPAMIPVKKKVVPSHCKYTGVTTLPYSKFKCRISSQGNSKDLGQFQLKSDAAMVYDEAAKLLPPCVHRPKPNFTDFDKYNEARKEEIQLKYNENETDEKIDFESFAEQFPIPHDAIKEAALCQKLDLDRLELMRWRKNIFLNANSGKVNTNLHDLCWSCGKEENGWKHPCLKFPTCKECSDAPYLGDKKCTWCFREDTGDVFLCDGKEGKKCKKQFCADCVFMSRGGGTEGVEYVKRIETEGEREKWMCPSCDFTPTMKALRAIPGAAPVKQAEENSHAFIHGQDDYFFPDDPSDDEADLRKANVPFRVSKLPNNGRQSTENEVIEIFSSDEEDNDEAFSIARAVPVESVKSTSMNRTESVTASVSSSVSVKVKEDIVDSRVVQTSKTNAVHSEVPENRPATEQNQASTINEMSPVQVSPTHNTTTNLVNAHLVLKEPLMQIFGIQSMEEVITEYCKELCKKGYGNEQFLTLEILKELKEDQLEKMLDFMETPHILAVKKWIRDRK